MRIRRDVAAGRAAAEELIRLGATIFSTGLRLALPVAGMLLLVDLALALVGRINAQVQMITIAFPLKMGLALLMSPGRWRHFLVSTSSTPRASWPDRSLLAR